jgi:hypothetical protein
MKRISRREFHRLAAIGAISGALAHASPQPQAPQTQTAASKPPTKILLTAEQEKKVAEKVAERDQDMAGLRSHSLPYTLEPAFVFRARVPQRRPAAKG